MADGLKSPYAVSKLRIALRKLIYVLVLGSLVFPPGSAALVRAQEQPSFSGHLAYTGGDGNIWVLPGDGGAALRITQDAVEGHAYASPRWSPDGKMLAFCRRDVAVPESSSLVFVRTGDWQPFTLVEDVFCRSRAQGVLEWSPDGRRIAFARASSLETRAMQQGIWAVDVVTGEQSELLPAPGGIPLSAPQWSPDGAWLKVYEIYYLESSGILRTWNASSGALYNWLELGHDLYPGASDWSPDGAQVVFDEVTYQGFPGAGLYTASPDGSNLRKIYGDARRAASGPLWSPAGNRIAFSVLKYRSDGRRDYGLVLLDTANGQVQEIATGQGVSPLIWAPDGSKLLFSAPSEGSLDLHLYDLASGTHARLVPGAQPDADWTALEQLPAPSEAAPPSRISDFPYQEGLLVYLAPGYQLMLRNPATGAETPISPPMSAAAFQASPTGQRLVYGRTWLALEFAPEGELALLETKLPSFPLPGSLHWSPDENRLAYQDNEGKVWMVALGGSALEIPGASASPAWSFAGDWLAFCQGDESLWLLGNAVEPRQVADGVDCSAQWSASQDLLAFTRREGQDDSPAGVYLYDPKADKAHLLAPDASLGGWSPDGRLLAVRRNGEASHRGDQTIDVYDPQSDQKVAVGQLVADQVGVATWTRASDGYFYGPYRLSTDVRAVDRLADSLFAASVDGSRLLVGIGGGSLLTVACLDTITGERTDLLTVDLTGLPEAYYPGVWGQLSPNGEWAGVYAYNPGSLLHLLSKCGGEQRWSQYEPVAGIDSALPGAFSSDSRWYLRWGQDGQDGPALVMHDLTLGITQTLTAISGTPLAWLHSRATTPPGRFVITGKVSGPGGVPVPGAKVSLEGKKGAETLADGSYVIGGLKPGSYTLVAEYPGLNLIPASRTILLPPDANGVDFQVAQPTATLTVAEAAETQIAAQVEATPPPASVLDTAASWLPALTQPPLLWGALICLGLLVLVIVLALLLWRRWCSRRKRLASVMPAPAGPLEDTQPTRAVTLAATSSPVETQPVPAVSQPVRAATQPDAARTPEPAPPRVAKATPEVEQTPPPAPAETTSRDWLREGIEQVKRGDLHEGINNLHRVVAVDAENGNAWLWLGWAAAQQNDLRTAERCFKRALRLGHPKAEEGLRWLRGD